MRAMRKYIGWTMLWLCLVSGGASIAQETEETCPLIVHDAIAAVADLCEETGRNQACYGNLTLVAEPQAGVTHLQFENPGDIAEVVQIRSLTLSGMDAGVPEWGVVMMRLQANLPDTLPGQNVTILLFGDVEIVNAVEPEDEAQSPMQAIYLRSGIGDSACAEAPESGILVQTPQGVGTVALTVNGVDIAFGSTVFLQAQTEDALYVYLLQGQAAVAALTVQRTLPAGTVVAVPLAVDGQPSAPPSEPTPYEKTKVGALAAALSVLPQPVEIVAPPIIEEAVPAVPPEVTPDPTFGGEVLIFNMVQCGSIQPQSGEPVRFMQGVYCDTSLGKVLAAMERNYPISIDGVPLYTYLGMAYEPCHGGMVGYNLNAYADWIATEGTHTFTAYNIGEMFSCTFAVEPQSSR